MMRNISILGKLRVPRFNEAASGFFVSSDYDWAAAYISTPTHPVNFESGNKAGRTVYIINSNF